MEKVWILKIGGFYDCNPQVRVFSDFYKASECLESEYARFKSENPEFLERFNSKYSKILRKPKSENGNYDGFVFSINDYEVQ